MINFKPFFDKVGQLFAKELQLNIERQSDINGQRFSPIAVSTAKERQRQKGFGQGLAIRLQTGATKQRVSKRKLSKGTELKGNISVPLTRLLFTRRFMQRAFKFSAQSQEVSVFVNDNFYTGDEQGKRSHVTYADIVRFNNQGSPEVNTAIKSPPLVFPHNSEQVRKMDSWKNSIRLLNSPSVKKDIAEQIYRQNLEAKQVVEVKI